MIKINKLIYVVLFTSILLTACNRNQEEEYKEFTYLPELTHEEFKTKFDAGEEFFVYIGRPDCGDSRKFEAEFEDLFVVAQDDEYVIRHDIDESLYYFNISDLIPGFDKQLRKEYQEEYDFYYTPTLLHYKDIDGDGTSDAFHIAEWDAIKGFNQTDYMKWFYDTGLIIPDEDVLHPGGSDRVEK